mgnify:CR=1 FL=1
MSFLNSVLKIFVGDKSKQDVKAITPLVDKIKTFEKILSGKENSSFKSLIQVNTTTVS